MLKHAPYFVLTLACCCLITSPCHADLIAGNTFDGSTDGSDPFTAGEITAAGVTSSGVSRPGYINNGGFDALVASELRTFTQVLNFTRYFGITITPDVGTTIDFDDFSYSGFETLAAGATLGPNTFVLRSDIDGFGGSGDIPTLGGAAGVTGGTFDLSGTQYQDVTGPVEFRLYIQSPDTSEYSPNTSYSLDNFSINGTVTSTVPEPSSFLLVGSIASLALFRRKRVVA
jgi:hypothetical protein